MTKTDEELLCLKTSFFKEMEEAEKIGDLGIGFSIRDKYHSLGVPKQILNFWMEELANYPVISLRNRFMFGDKV